MNPSFKKFESKVSNVSGITHDGNLQTLNPPIPGVKVWTDVQREVDAFDKNTFASVRKTVTGICISIAHKQDAHLLQLVTRRQFDATTQQFLQKAHSSHDQRTKYSTKANPEYWVDASPQANTPYFEDASGVPCQKTIAEPLIVYDFPGVSSDLKATGDYNKFTAYAFCIADGGLLGIIKWTAKVTYPSSAKVYKVKSLKADVLATQEIITVARSLLENNHKNKGKDWSGYILPWMKI